MKKKYKKPFKTDAENFAIECARWLKKKEIPPRALHQQPNFAFKKSAEGVEAAQ
jgi:hypothetical protein